MAKALEYSHFESCNVKKSDFVQNIQSYRWRIISNNCKFLNSFNHS
jgi:hypothetical protein